MTNFGNRLGQMSRLRRGELGLSQRELAIRIWNDEAYKSRVSELENGKVKRPHQATVVSFQKALRISNAQILALRSGENLPEGVAFKRSYVLVDALERAKKFVFKSE